MTARSPRTRSRQNPLERVLLGDARPWPLADIYGMRGRLREATRSTNARSDALSVVNSRLGTNFRLIADAIAFMDIQVAVERDRALARAARLRQEGA